MGFRYCIFFPRQHPICCNINPYDSYDAVRGMDVAPIWWALSLGACLGGNGTLIGASANVVLSGISKNNGHPITFGQYFKIGFPMMILSIIVCSVFLLIRFA